MDLLIFCSYPSFLFHLRSELPSRVPAPASEYCLAGQLVPGLVSLCPGFL